MKTNIIHFVATCLVYCVLGVVVTACSYDDYADADYPESQVYQSMADGIIRIDANANAAKAEVPTPGAPILYDIDNQKLRIHLGVVQSGISYISGSVLLQFDANAITTRQAEGQLPAEVIVLPASAVVLPAEVGISGVSAPYIAEVSLSAITDAAYTGKQVAFAVTIASTTIKVSEQLATQVVVIDTDFVKSLL